jgi:hypothetical protein
MKANKYKYYVVIQQNYGYGWEDVSFYESNSNGVTSEMSGSFRELKNGRKRELTLEHDLKEYRLTNYPTRTINRKELNNLQTKHTYLIL